MAKKQTRRSVSVTGATYEAIRLDCEEREISLSEYIESLIKGDRQARGLPSVAVRSEHAREVGRAIAAGRRASRKQVEQAAEAVRAVPLPAESKITVGLPPEQTAMLGRRETPPRRPLVHRCPCCGGATLRRDVRCATCAITCTKRDDGSWSPGKMCPLRKPAWVEPMKPAPSCAKDPRPTHGDRVPPPAPGRGPGNVVSF